MTCKRGETWDSAAVTIQKNVTNVFPEDSLLSSYSSSFYSLEQNIWVPLNYLKTVLTLHLELEGCKKTLSTFASANIWPNKQATILDGSQF